MELSKEEAIFSIINKHSELLVEDNECIINILNGNLSWTENEFNNFNNVMTSLKYDIAIDEEFLEVACDEDVLIIRNITNIIKYCSNNDHNLIPHSWIKKKIVVSDLIKDLFDADIKMNIIKTTANIEPPNWDELRKYFKIIKNINYTKNDNTFMVKIVKENNNEYYNLKQSGIINSHQKYEFDIKIKDHSKSLESIIKAMQSINLSNIILTKPQQTAILNEYSKLIEKDIRVRFYDKTKNEVQLITPKPVTLERMNLIDPNEYGAVSILSGYTVTEKADGERILMYINSKGNVYIINNTLRVEDTGIIADLKIANSLIDGEYITCNKRTDIHKRNIYAAFDIYYLNNKKLTDLPLIDTKKCRYHELNSIVDLMYTSKSTIDFIVKKHLYSDNILKDCNDILTNHKNYPYEIDGLIFTPAKLPLYSYYPGKPVEITDNMKWDRVFKWKPAEQNTIDFLTKFNKEIIRDGQKYMEILLFIGYNSTQWEEINPDKGIRLRYDRDYFKANRAINNYIPKLFKPIDYYYEGVDKAFIKVNTKGEIKANNGDKIEKESIVEFSYDVTKKEWVPLRVREDKVRIYNKGILSKTANELGVALNIWRSIHNPVSTAMITGNKRILSNEAPDDIEDRTLDTSDIYYSRTIPRDSLLSIHMLNFHNQGIKRELYSKPSSKGSLLELACGEGGDMNRWIDSNYKFVLGVDLVKSNICNPRSGAYSRMIKRRGQYIRKQEEADKLFFTDMVFVVGDCGANIKDGTASYNVGDEESAKILKIVMNNQKNVPNYYRYISGKGIKGFDAVSCMFAIHYFFESENKLDGFLNNVSSNLKKGGSFFCTFMDGKTVIDSINKNDGKMIEGRKTFEENSIPVWAIIKQFSDSDLSFYNKKIDVYIENTQKLISEYVVNYELLLTKAKLFNLEISESEMFGETFNKLKANISSDESKKTHLDNDLKELDKDNIQKQFSFLNRWCVFKKI